MKSFLITFLFLFLSISSFAQLGGEDEVYLTGDMIEPKFNGGGLEKFYEFANKEFDFSKFTKSEKITASFTIDANGDLNNIKVIQFDNVESATEIMRVLTKSPKWKPAQKGGNAIAVDIKFPFDIKLNESKSVNTETLVKDKALKDPISGGMSKFYNFIKSNYNMPQVPGLKGKVIVTFDINEDGSIGNYKIIRDVKHGTGQELIRVLKLSSGKWTPAVENGKPIKSTFTLPLTINIPED